MNDTIFPPSKFTRQGTIIALAVLSAIVLALYLPMLNNYYFADELDVVYSSQKLHHAIQDGESSILEVFRPDYIKVPGRFNTHFRPMGYFFGYVVYAIFGKKPIYLNALLVMMHLITVLLVFAIFRLLTENDWWALLASLIFGIDGIASEAVFYIGAGQLYMPEAVFHYTCIVTYILWMKRRRFCYLLISWLTALLSVVANEFSWTLIPLLLSIELFFGKKPRISLPLKPQFYPYYLWMAGYFFIAIRPIAYRARVAESFLSTFFNKRIFTYCSEFGLVIKRVPVLGDICQPLSPTLAGGIFAVIIILLIILSIFIIRDKRYRFMLVWLFLTTLLLLPLKIAARYLYHTLIPFWGAMVFFGIYTVRKLQDKFPSGRNIIRTAGIAVFVMLVVGQASLTHQREALWDDMGDYHRRQIQKILPLVDDWDSVNHLYFFRTNPLVPGKQFTALAREIIDHLRVYLDRPDMEYTLIIDPAMAPAFNRSLGGLVLIIKERAFVPADDEILKRFNIEYR